MKKILLLDDNLDIVQIVEEVLTYENFEVKSAMKSVGFLPIVEQYNPHMIILDYRLNDGNGGEVCRAIKQHPQFKHIPIIIFTAYMHPGLDLRMYGCDAIIPKPFDLDNLVDTIKTLLDTQGRGLEVA
jgi:CheY-like chemotaxis protein